MCEIEIAGHLRDATAMIHRVTQLLAQATAVVKELDHDAIVAVQLCAELDVPITAPEGSALASLLDERGRLNELGYAVAALL